MRYIDGITLYFQNYDILEVPCVYYNNDFRSRGDLAVVIRDTSSDWSKTVFSERCAWLDFEFEIARFNPYGYIPKSKTIEGFQDSMLVVSDDWSLRFLEYVEDIGPVRPSSDANLLRHLRGLHSNFTFCDETLSFVDVNPHAWRNHAFPLFQGLCFAKEGWYGDRIYMNTVWCGKESWHYVSFSDVSKARSMFAKAALQGYNPIRENLSALNRI